MSIRATHTAGLGPLYFAVCNECKVESEHSLIAGVAHTDGALPALAMPHGWTSEIHRRTPVSAPIQFDYCPACSVAPEYRKGA